MNKRDIAEEAIALQAWINETHPTVKARVACGKDKLFGLRGER